jgi:hypothetical protein
MSDSDNKQIALHNKAIHSVAKAVTDNKHFVLVCTDNENAPRVVLDNVTDKQFLRLVVYLSKSERFKKACETEHVQHEIITNVPWL